MSEQKTRRDNGFVDITGQTFGHLTVLERAKSSGGGAIWKCRCTCGEEVTFRGTELRKGSRRSCGCKNPHKPRVVPPPNEGHYWVVESDGLVALVHSTRQGEALVEFSTASKSWKCSVCGPQPKLACGHIAAFTARLPLRAAVQVARAVTTPKDRPVSGRAGGAAEGAAANERALSVAGVKSALERAERVARHDSEYQRVTSPVVVREMTDDDRAKLAERRAAKHRRVGTA